MAASEGPCRDLPYVGDAPRKRAGGRGLRTHEMGAHLGSLAVLEISVGGGDAALPGRAAIAISARAHGTAGLAPEEPGIAEHTIATGRLGGAFHRCRSRHDHCDDAPPHSPAAPALGRGL